MKLPSILFHEIKNKKILWGVMLTLSFLITFSMLYIPPTDPDLGWHIKTGDLIIERDEIPRVDWFSHTFSDFPWVDHEYLSNIFISTLNTHLGTLSISIVYVALIAFTLVYLVGEATVAKISLGHRALLAPLFALAFTHFTGARPQTVTWVFFVLVLVILARMKKNAKSRAVYALPFLFLLWANLHGGSVVLGVVSLGIILFAEGVKLWDMATHSLNMKFSQTNSLSYASWLRYMILSVIATATTLLNPYGYRIYEELARTLTDSFSKHNINEWLQPDFQTYNGAVLLIFLFLTLLLFFLDRKKRMDFTQFVFFVCILFLAFQSVRHIPLFVVAVAPYILEATKEIYEILIEPVVVNAAICILLSSTLLITYILFTDLPENIVYAASEDGIAYAAGAPLGAVHYLQRHQLPGKMYNSYNWGGYLIEHLPSEKVFIDGRMPHWRNSEKHLFKEQRSIAAGDGAWQMKLDSYGVGFAVMERGEGLIAAMNQSANWERVYHDDVSVIYINKNFHDQKDNKDEQDQ